ncbi:unnamed protein product [Lupinus luteus]|uniref:Uncharacterized protein n=1 Tax=Lupinus luteus TaxID=3873 RepID=A0AAV1YC68_LUPLU
MFSSVFERYEQKNGNREVQKPVHSVAESNSGMAKSLKKNKLWIALSKEENEEDIFAMTGTRRHRRPTERPKNVQKQMDWTNCRNCGRAAELELELQLQFKTLTASTRGSGREHVNRAADYKTSLERFRTW